MSQGIDELWELVLVLATAVFVLVMAAYLISLVRFRERKNDDRRPKQVHGNTRLEITWTIIPAVLLAVLAVPTVRGIFELRSPPEGEGVLQVQVTGHQWWWEYVYPDIIGDDGRPLTTANELHIPAGVEVNLTMTSGDVIHSYWVPPLNGKRDLVPGRVSQLTLTADEEAATVDLGFGPGVILGQCAEFCGLSHANMRQRVVVEDQASFDAWVAEQFAPAVVPETGPIADAYVTFTGVCVACHQATVALPDGTVETVGPDNFITARPDIEFKSSYGPNLTHFGSRATFAGASIDNTREHLAEWLADPSALKPMLPQYNDLPEGRILGMPNFNLTNEEIDNLVMMLESWR
jgi:cytochrome c oxidase subunit 2